MAGGACRRGLRRRPCRGAPDHGGYDADCLGELSDGGPARGSRTALPPRADGSLDRAETTAFRLPPSRLALDPADVVTLAHDGRHIPLRLVSIADAEARGIEAVRQDREAHDLPPGSPRPSSLSQTVVFGAPEVALLDLPQLTEDQPAHRPFAAAHAVPWPGEMAVFRSPRPTGSSC